MKSTTAKDLIFFSGCWTCFSQKFSHPLVLIKSDIYIPLIISDIPLIISDPPLKVHSHPYIYALQKWVLVANSQSRVYKSSSYPLLTLCTSNTKEMALMCHHWIGYHIVLRWNEYEGARKTASCVTMFQNINFSIYFLFYELVFKLLAMSISSNILLFDHEKLLKLNKNL